MGTYLLPRRAALAAFGVWAVAGLSGCNTAPTPAVQSVASGFRISAIRSKPRRWSRRAAIRPPTGRSRLCPVSSPKPSRRSWRRAIPAGRRSTSESTPSTWARAGAGDPDQMRGSATLSGGAGPTRVTRVRAIAIYISSPVDQSLPEQALQGRVQALWRSPSRIRWRGNCGSENLKSNRPRHCGRRAHIASCRGDVPWASRRVRIAAGGIRRPASHRPLSARAPARAVGS